MKDQYVGDINDFAKYQLLRLATSVFDDVHVAWMLTGKDGRGDGGRIGYLSEPAQGATDPELFDELAKLVERGDRSVAAVERSQVIPGCLFDRRPVPLDHTTRAQYFGELAGRTGPRSLVFFDPDNGLEVPSVAKHRRGAERYLFWDELAVVRKSGASVLVYQHFPRVGRPAYMENLLTRLHAEMGGEYEVFASHTSLVAFLFAVRRDLAAQLRSVIEGRCAESTLLSYFNAYS